jgi:hypothetical protein
MVLDELSEVTEFDDTRKGIVTLRANGTAPCTRPDIYIITYS